MATNIWTMFFGMNGRDIYHNFRGGTGDDAKGLVEASIKVAMLAKRYNERTTSITGLTTKMESAWQGDAAGAAARGAGPLAVEHGLAQEGMNTAHNTLYNQSQAFASAKAKVTEVPPEPDKPGTWDNVFSFGGAHRNYEQKMTQVDTANDNNVAVMDAYETTTSSNTSALPTTYGRITDDYAAVGVDKPSPPPVNPPYNPGIPGNSYPGTGNTGTGNRGTGTTGGNNSTNPSGNRPPGGSTRPPGGGTTVPSNNRPPTTLPPGGRLPGGQNPNQPNNPAMPGMLPPAGFGPGGGGPGGGPRGGGGFGPRGSGGFGPGGGAPGSSSGGPGSGGRGSGFGPGAGGAAAAAEGAAARGGAGGRGGMGMGGMGHGAGKKGEGDEDGQHERPSFLVEPDPHDTFGSDEVTAPPVIGE
jgi:hypothetical protein